VVTRLFHPRSDAWAEHFEWNGPFIAARTDVARATLAVLRINHPDALAIREVLMAEGLWGEADAST
jgi:hypothetical protein